MIYWFKSCGGFDRPAKFCLVLKWHQEGSAISGATPSSLDPDVCFLKLLNYLLDVNLKPCLYEAQPAISDPEGPSVPQVSWKIGEGTRIMYLNLQKKLIMLYLTLSCTVYFQIGDITME